MCHPTDIAQRCDVCQEMYWPQNICPWARRDHYSRDNGSNDEITNHGHEGTNGDLATVPGHGPFRAHGIVHRLSYSVSFRDKLGRWRLLGSCSTYLSELVCE
jgi:hypothetical protein